MSELDSVTSITVEPAPIILLAEDDPVTRMLMTRFLKKAGYEVDAVANGSDALDRMTTRHYPMLVTDWEMPEMDGVALCKAVRNLQLDGYVYALLLTARDAKEHIITGLEAGADDYLTKPFAFAELLIRVKALLRRGPVSRASVLRVADLEVDRLTNHVKRAGKTIELTPKEYALLEYLATHPGRVFSRTMIIEHVWDQSFEGLTNIVDVYVRHLRSKVDDPFPTKLIKTVRGVGYGLVESTEA